MNSTMRWKLWEWHTSSPSLWSFSLHTTKPELAQVLSQEKPNTMIANNNGWLVIKGESKHIVSSTVQQGGETLIDSAMELDPVMTSNIYYKLQKNISWLWFDDPYRKEDHILQSLQHILTSELGIISNISSAEAEQSQAIATSETGIIKSKNLSQKMCTLRAGYTAQVLNKLWREATTLCGHMDGKWHARNILKSPSGQMIMYDPMNPKMDQQYPFINSINLSSNQYHQLKKWQYIWPIVMNNHTYKLGLN